MSDIGVFTTLKISQGVPLFFDKHKTRLLSHAKQLGITPPPFSVATVTSYVKEHNLKNCALKITITADALSLGHRAVPTSKPLKVITVQDTREVLVRTLKTTNREANTSARKLAEEKGADDALFVSDGLLIESTYANIFSLEKDGTISTPPVIEKGLQGIARQVIMERIPVKEVPLSKETTLPIVLVNSLRVQPVISVDGRKLPDATALAKKLQTILES